MAGFISASDPLVVALAGDSIVQHRLSANRDPRFVELIELIKGADASLTNLEGVIQADEGEDPPAFIAGQGGFGSNYDAIPPWVSDEMRELGFDLVFTANNHASDFGENGILTTLDYLDAAGLPHSGSGRNLSEATAPTYLYTPHGRVGVVNASDNGIRSRGEIPFPVPRGCFAADQGPFFVDRPGINMLRYEPIYHVDQQTIDAFKRASEALGWEQDKALRRAGGGLTNPSVGASATDKREDINGLFHFNGTKYVLDDKFMFETVPFPEDLERNFTWIREARRNADVVVVGMHQQGGAWNEDAPPDHTRIFAHGAIDAGADIFVGHGGSNRMSGVEIYNGGVIIYGVPGFVTRQRRLRVPGEQIARFGLPNTTTPGEWMDYTRNLRRNDGASTTFGQLNPAKGHALFTVEFGADKKVSRVLLYPTAMTKGEATGGGPSLAVPGDEVNESVLEVAAQRSLIFGTKLEVEKGVGVIQVA